nr:protein BCCIP homolog [Ipomoea trifida]
MLVKVAEIYPIDVYFEDAAFWYTRSIINIMPHKLTRHRRLLRYKPFGFSPFARSIAQLASDNKVKRKIYNGLQEKNYPSSSGNGVLNHTQGGKNQHSDSSDDEFEGTVQADFEFFDPKPDDFHGVKNSKCIMELKKFLLNACQDKNVQANLSSLLEEQSNNVGLLVSQRVVNLPPQLLPPLYDGLFDEISWATEDEPTEELRKSFCFKFYLVVSKIYKHKNADKKTIPSKRGDEAIIYVKPEEEILHELSSWSFTFPMHSQPVRTDELKDYQITGLVMAVEANKISKFRKQLNSLIDNS